MDPVSNESLRNDPADAIKYLKTRSIFIATPCYGGMMTVNYTRSLMALTNACMELGIPYTVSFKYNESLIPRARNSMVNDYLCDTNATDFFFIDADIGFEARDIISLLLYPENRIIGAPCVRKSLNWNRIVKALKENDKVPSQDDLLRLGGEFVMNFDPANVPTKFDMSQLLEVRDIGTGLMRVQRNVFEEIQTTFPENTYLPMSGEESKPGTLRPTYMFFQSGIDPDSAKFNPGGLPHYVPEDYAFCHLAAKCGIKIYIAPWMKTSHAGTMIFEGDLGAVARAGGSLR